MRTWLARHVFYPSQDALRGRNSVGHAADLERSQWNPPAAIAARQLEDLRAMLTHAVAHTPFYAGRCRAAGLDPADLAALDDLQRLPVLRRGDIRRHHDDMTARVACGRITRAWTSGSSGAPLEFTVDNRRRRADIAARLRAHRWFGIEPGDPAVYLWGPRCEREVVRRLKDVRDWLINETLLNAFELSPERMDRYADTLLRVQPVYVYAYASALWRFARFIADCRPELKGIVRRTAFATGEQLVPVWRQDIIRSLECSVAEEYGTREAGLIAHECPEESYHIVAEHVIVEILDDGDRPVPAGEPGRIVVTNLEAMAMPFVRYDTGDRGALRPGTCACGRGLPMMERPGGRAHEFLETADGVPITARCISRDLADVRGVLQYRVIQEARDRVRVLVVPAPGAAADAPEQGSALETELCERIQRHLGAATRVIIERVTDLPPDPSGKWPYIVNAMRMGVA